MMGMNMSVVISLLIWCSQLNNYKISEIQRVPPKTAANLYTFRNYFIVRATVIYNYYNLRFSVSGASPKADRPFLAIGSVRWHRAFTELFSQAKPLAREYVILLSQHSNPEIRAACYDYAGRFGWDECIPSAEKDLHDTRLLFAVGPNRDGRSLDDAARKYLQGRQSHYGFFK